MEASNINVILAAACLIAGIGIGALGYHLLNGGARNAQKLRQRLTERERQIAEWKDGVDEHFTQMDTLIQRLLEGGQNLRQQLDESAKRLGREGTPSKVTPPGNLQISSLTPSDDAAQEDLKIPRDYADGNSGTLSEDYGLRKEDEDDDEASPRPPRY